ncbi:FAD dependent oxidoreductase [Halorubrum californiense DSM 19288]|uniref:FAD dependent oxidoreductase n=1 Tax=Halorubrum californiense DSM 19288 TaxID=1227465 RepID=M0ELD9_9EURY|nr:MULTISPECIES: FAD-binding oxidoreductase [Halorubrum]ELZ48576.1 FAD dependent oxidoreductase [Halorubrum californiense DSM 19288]TKX66553.1 FAD-binding oxidoreductase [Halorubrum sp. GN11GM_10-3_MGM]
MTERDESAPTVAVVGGGAVGVTAAHDLAARGADVSLFERGALAAESSGRAAGLLYDAYAEDVDAAVGARALERFRAFDRSLPGFSFTPCPYVIAVREGDPDADAVPAMVERMRDHDREVSVVDPDALGERFPALRTDDLAVAAVAEGAGWTDPPSYVRALGERAVSEGVAVETETAVALGPRTDGGREVRLRDPGADGDSAAETRAVDAVVVAAGARTRSLLADAGVSVPVVPYRVQALVARGTYDGPMAYDATADAYVRPHPDGLLAGDGTEPVPADPDGYRREADDWFREDVAAVLDERLARRGSADRADRDLDDARAWAGLCTATPDGDPLVGPVDPAEGDPTLFVAAGWQGHGFMRAPAVGEAVAEGVLASLAGVDFDSPDSPWIGAFDPTRFDGDEAFEIVEGMSLSNRTEER